MTKNNLCDARKKLATMAIPWFRRPNDSPTGGLPTSGLIRERMERNLYFGGLGIRYDSNLRPRNNLKTYSGLRKQNTLCTTKNVVKSIKAVLAIPQNILLE